MDRWLPKDQVLFFKYKLSTKYTFPSISIILVLPVLVLVRALVPMNVDTNVSVLPSSFSDIHTIQLKLMRQMKNRNAFMYETIRLKVVRTAVKYLVDHQLHKDEGIVISHGWLKEHSNERENFIIENEDKYMRKHRIEI